VRAGRGLEDLPVGPIDAAEAAADDDSVRVKHVDEKRDTLAGGGSGSGDDLCRKRIVGVLIENLLRTLGAAAHGAVRRCHGWS
jgi:hypothetical protein